MRNGYGKATDGGCKVFQEIKNPGDFVWHGKNRKAIVSIIIGHEYRDVWEWACQESWVRYAEKFDYDLVIIADHLDHSPRGLSRSPSWQKLLVLAQPWASLYEQIVWLDADIVVSDAAENIVDHVPDKTKIGICRFGGQMSDAEKHIFLERLYNTRMLVGAVPSFWSQFEKNGFNALGLGSTTHPMFNCGMFVVSPRHHSDLLLKVYAEEEGRPRLYEQPNLSYAIGEAGVANILSPRFNWSVHEFLTLGVPYDLEVQNRNLDKIIFQTENELQKSYFLHYCGSMPLLKIIAELKKQKAVPSAERVADSQASQDSSVGPDWSGADYVSPNLVKVTPDAFFKNMIVGDPSLVRWPYLRVDSPHHWYTDRRSPNIGFLSRDEAVLLFNIALPMAGRQALEVGCFLGWSACHLALAGVNLDVVDPVLAKDDYRASVVESLSAAGVMQRCQLVAAPSPLAVSQLAEALSRTWSLIFIDGDHEGDAPLQDAIECAKHAAPDCIVVFHDLYSPHVAEGLRYFKTIGWNIRVYMTTQIMGVAWRGAAMPPEHVPDPRIADSWPVHLKDLVEGGG